METNLLSGVHLNFWIATIEGIDFAISDVYRSGARSVITFYGRNEDDFLDGRSYCPCSHPSDGFPLVEKRFVSLHAPGSHDLGTYWLATMSADSGTENRHQANAASALEAAMRCIVKSQYGEYVPAGEYEQALERSASIVRF